MTILAELTLEEQRLAELMGYLRAVDKEAWQRASRGVFDRYREVHRQYAALARLGDVEALRRAGLRPQLEPYHVRRATETSLAGIDGTTASRSRASS
jgi:hypothetical protein